MPDYNASTYIIGGLAILFSPLLLAVVVCFSSLSFLLSLRTQTTTLLCAVLLLLPIIYGLSAHDYTMEIPVLYLIAEVLAFLGCVLLLWNPASFLLPTARTALGVLFCTVMALAVVCRVNGESDAFKDWLFGSLITTSVLLINALPIPFWVTSSMKKLEDAEKALLADYDGSFTFSQHVIHSLGTVVVTPSSSISGLSSSSSSKPTQPTSNETAHLLSPSSPPPVTSRSLIMVHGYLAGNGLWMNFLPHLTTPVFEDDEGALHHHTIHLSNPTSSPRQNHHNNSNNEENDEQEQPHRFQVFDNIFCVEIGGFGRSFRGDKCDKYFKPEDLERKPLYERGQRMDGFDWDAEINTAKNSEEMLDAMARKLYLWILELRKDEDTKVVLLAHSLGAIVCSYLTSKHPELIDQLILVSPAGMVAKPPQVPTAQARSPIMGFIQYIWDKGLVIPDLVKFLGPFGRHVTHSILSKRIGFTSETSDFRRTNVDLLNEYCYQNWANARSGDAALRFLLAPGAWGIAGYTVPEFLDPLYEREMRERRRKRREEKEEEEDDVSTSSTPHLSFIYGDAGLDWMKPQQASALIRKLKEKYASTLHLSLQAIPDAGHLVFLDEPEAVALAVKNAVNRARNI